MTALLAHPVALDLSDSPPCVISAERAARTLTVSQAVVPDVATISELIGLWAQRGLTVDRGQADIATHLRGFKVASCEAENGEYVTVACGAVQEIEHGLAEVRSIAVDPDAPKVGAGRRIVLSLIESARDRGLETLVLLTKAPMFFERCGFSEVATHSLPRVYREDYLCALGRTIEGRVAMTLRL